MDYLQNGVPVKYFDNGEERSTLVYLIEFKNPSQNDFTVANQWTFIENSEKRPDVILFVNGLPLVIVELKSLSREETDASDAYRQLRNYIQIKFQGKESFSFYLFAMASSNEWRNL